ncbi:MAG: hypothetical protein JXK07_04750 [Spirochaetes bacterium]|nr:hypothetical protein [Spirochaetota bacterium]MBN2772430.1 hypothetical protein [Spirochaetota bacterium]
MTLILRNISFLFLLFLITVSCDGATEDLETVLNSSRTNVHAHGNDIYWKGKKVGKFKDVYGQEDDYEHLLKERGKWILKSGRIYTKDNIYDDFSTTIGFVKDIRDNNGNKCYVYFSMIVPVSPISSEIVTHYFVYNPGTGELEEVSKIQNSSNYSPVNFSSDVDKLFVDYEPYFSSNEQNQQTINQQSVSGTNSQWRYLFVESRFNYRSWKMTQENPDNAHSKISTSVEPLMLLQIVGGVAAFDSFFKFDYETDFGYGGGSVETGKEAQEQFGLDENTSYLLKLAAGTKGVEVNYLIEEFQYGNYDYRFSSDDQDPQRDLLQQRAFQTSRRQIEVLYHPGWRDIPRLGGTAGKTKIIDTYFGYRYMTFKVPKIFYTYVDDKDDDDYNIVTGESTPQFVETRAHVIGMGANNHMSSTSPGFNLLYGIELFGGYAQCRMKKYDYYHENYLTADEKASITEFNYPFVDFGFSLGFSANYNIGMLKTSLFAICHVNYYYELINKFQRGDTESETDIVSNQENRFTLITAGANIYF